MTLRKVLSEKAIKSRHELLAKYLANAPLGEVQGDEASYFKQIFANYYSPDTEEEKFPVDSIEQVAIDRDPFNNKYFTIYVAGNWYPTSIKRLAGSKRTHLANLTRALRSAIEEQILAFRMMNLLDPVQQCPILGKPLGNDAEVDHMIPFHELKDDWLRVHKDAAFEYDLVLCNYVLKEPWLSDWRRYHEQKAVLRYVSKEGNTIAHRL